MQREREGEMEGSWDVAFGKADNDGTCGTVGAVDYGMYWFPWRGVERDIFVSSLGGCCCEKLSSVHVLWTRLSVSPVNLLGRMIGVTRQKAAPGANAAGACFGRAVRRPICLLTRVIVLRAFVISPPPWNAEPQPDVSNAPKCSGTLRLIAVGRFTLACRRPRHRRCQKTFIAYQAFVIGVWTLVARRTACVIQLVGGVRTWNCLSQTAGALAALTAAWFDPGVCAHGLVNLLRSGMPPWCCCCCCLLVQCSVPHPPHPSHGHPVWSLAAA